MIVSKSENCVAFDAVGRCAYGKRLKSLRKIARYT